MLCILASPPVDDQLIVISVIACMFFFNDTATTEIYTLSLHDALPISRHALAPIGHGRAVAPLLRIRIGAVLGVPRRAPQRRTACMCPLYIVVFGEPAVDQIIGRRVAAGAQGLDFRARQAAIRAAGVDVD